MTEQKETDSPQVKSKPLPANAPKPPGDIRRSGKATKRTGPFVKYVGRASHRKITPAQWRALGAGFLEAKGGHTWSVANDKMIESAEFSDEQLDYLLIDDKQPGTNGHSFLRSRLQRQRPSS